MGFWTWGVLKMPILNKIVVWRNDDGSMVQACFIDKAKRENETEDEFIERVTQKIIKSKPALKNKKKFDISKTELKHLIKTHPKGHTERLKITNQGQLYIDENVKTIKEQEEEDQINTKNALKNLGLSDDIVDVIMKNKKYKPK